MAGPFLLFAGLFLLSIALPGQDRSPTAAVVPAVPDLLKDAEKAYYSHKFETAIESYQTVLRQDPKSGEAYAGLTRVFLKQEKLALASATASQGMLQVSNFPPMHTALGEVYFRQGRMMDAEKEFLSAAHSSPADARACLGLARLYDAYSQHALARRMLNRAHDLAPDDVEVQRRWIGAQKRSDQIHWIKDYLPRLASDDTATRRDIEEWLALLEAREKQAHASCRLVTPPASTETEIMRLGDPQHFLGYGLDVRVNGHSAHLELDTGASGLLIDKGLAAKAGIHAVTNLHLLGVGDEKETEAFVGYADSIKIGHLEFQDCPVTVLDKISGLDIGGVIGPDVFGRYLVTIDFPNQKLRLEGLPQRPGQMQEPPGLSIENEPEDFNEDQPSEGTDTTHSAPAEARDVSSGPQDTFIAPEMKSYSRVLRFGHSLLISTTVGDTPPKLFLIDTGAMLNNISTDAAREVTKVHGNSSVHLQGLTGQVTNVYDADKVVVQFSHFRQKNLNLATLDLSSLSYALGTEVSGILGLQTLQQLTVKIDYRDGLVDFVYKAP